HIYIAQPPLYKIKKGKMERYLDKDEDMQRFLVENGVEDAALFPRYPDSDAPVKEAEAIRKSELRSIIDSLMALDIIDRTLHRKGTHVQEVLNMRNEDEQKRFPIGIFTTGEARKFAFDKQRYIELQDEVDPEEQARLDAEADAAAKKKAEETQGELSLDASADVDQDFQETEAVRRKYMVQD